MIIDLTPVAEGSGPARLLDMVQGRSKSVFKSWLAARPQDGIEVVAMDGFTGFKTAAAEELPDAVEVMDPFHVVRLASEALDKCVNTSSSTPAGNADATATRCIWRAGLCWPGTICSPEADQPAGYTVC